jgi:hypothetical protein
VPELSAKPVTLTPEGEGADWLGDGEAVGDGGGYGVGSPLRDALTKPRQIATDAESVSRSVGYCWLPSKYEANSAPLCMM